MTNQFKTPATDPATDDGPIPVVSKVEKAILPPLDTFTKMLETWADGPVEPPERTTPEPPQPADTGCARCAELRRKLNEAGIKYAQLENEYDKQVERCAERETEIDGLQDELKREHVAYCELLAEKAELEKSLADWKQHAVDVKNWLREYSFDAYTQMLRDIAATPAEAAQQKDVDDQG